MNKEKMQSIIKKSQHQFLIEAQEQFPQISQNLILFLAEGKEDDFESLKQFFHRMKGTSGTLELSGVSVISEEIEKLLSTLNDALLDDQFTMYKLIKKAAELLNEIEKQLNKTGSSDNGQRKDIQKQSSAKVLVAADDVSILNKIEGTLINQGMTVFISSNIEEILEYTESETMDLVILDYSLSQDKGIDFVKELNYINTATPVLILRESEQAVTGQIGQHYLEKTADSHQLISLVQDLLQASNKKPEETDAAEFTMAYTRKDFADHYEVEKKKFETYGDIFSVAFLDIDDFKTINDTYGNRFGDYLLLCFIEIIGNHLSDGRKLYRFGGDEFLILFPETDGSKAKMVIENIREDLTDVNFKATDNELPLTLTFSSGLTEYNTESLNKTTLLEEADKALYTAKEKGGQVSILLSKSTLVTTNKILVVDDEVLLANIIKTRLGYLGYEVDYAKDGQEALIMLNQTVYDLILLDIMLPKVTGIEVLKTFKEKNSDVRSKIIMISGKHSEAAVLESLKLGADDFFKKPFSLDVLEHKIKKILTS